MSCRQHMCVCLQKECLPSDCFFPGNQGKKSNLKFDLEPNSSQKSSLTFVHLAPPMVTGEGGESSLGGRGFPSNEHASHILSWWLFSETAGKNYRSVGALGVDPVFNHTHTRTWSVWQGVIIVWQSFWSDPNWETNQMLLSEKRKNGEHTNHSHAELFCRIFPRSCLYSHPHSIEGLVCLQLRKFLCWNDRKCWIFLSVMLVSSQINLRWKYIHRDWNKKGKEEIFHQACCSDKIDPSTKIF